MEATLDNGRARHRSEGDALPDVIDHLPDGLLVLDSNARFIYANRMARAISRIDEHHFNGGTLWELYPDLNGTPIQQACLRVAQTRVPEELNDFFYEPFQHWVRIRIQPAGDGIALYYRDVTEELHQKEERRISEERLRFALQAANGVGTWDWNVTTNQLYADANFARIYGVDPELAHAGAPIEAYIHNLHPEDVERVMQDVTHAVETSGEFASEYRIRQADGSTRWVAVRGRVLPSEDGVRFPGIVFDISNRKQTEEALIRAEKLAVVGRMASSIAHEINNPLESVMNLLFLARQAAILPSVQGYLDTAEQELRRVSVIANQTLRFHKQATRPTAITCFDLYSTVLSLYEGKLKNSNIAVEKRKRAEKPVACFEGDIRQVLNNLVGNAIDAMALGGRLLIRSREGTDWRTGEKGLVLTVADTGTGIARENMQRVFEAFFTTKGFNGTGLGLWVSHEIVERHGGRLLLRSSTDPQKHGTVASVFLPFLALGRESAA